MFQKLRQRTMASKIARDYYLDITTQARQPLFYSDANVADSLDGRFDMLILHLAIVVTALSHTKEQSIVTKDKENKLLCEALEGHFFRDMDRTLRELGVGDISVPKKMKKFASAWRGRLARYSNALLQSDKEMLCEALKRNLDAAEEKEVVVEVIADYMLANFSNWQQKPQNWHAFVI